MNGFFCFALSTAEELSMDFFFIFSSTSQPLEEREEFGLGSHEKFVPFKFKLACILVGYATGNLKIFAYIHRERQKKYGDESALNLDNFSIRVVDLIFFFSFIVGIASGLKPLVESLWVSLC